MSHIAPGDLLNARLICLCAFSMSQHGTMPACAMAWTQQHLAQPVVALLQGGTVHCDACQRNSSRLLSIQLSSQEWHSKREEHPWSVPGERSLQQAQAELSGRQVHPPASLSEQWAAEARLQVPSSLQHRHTTLCRPAVTALVVRHS